MCRRAHGAGYVTWVGVAESDFRITAGEDTLTHYKSSDHLTRSFCSRCGSSMLCNDSQHENVIDLAAGALQEPLDRPISSHIFYDCRAGWIEMNDDLQKLGGDGGLKPLQDHST